MSQVPTPPIRALLEQMHAPTTQETRSEETPTPVLGPRPAVSYRSVPTSPQRPTLPRSHTTQSQSDSLTLSESLVVQAPSRVRARSQDRTRTRSRSRRREETETDRSASLAAPAPEREREREPEPGAKDQTVIAVETIRAQIREILAERAAPEAPDAHAPTAPEDDPDAERAEIAIDERLFAEAHAENVQLVESETLEQYVALLDWDRARARTGPRTYVTVPSQVVRPPGRVTIEQTLAERRRVLQLAETRRGVRLPMLEHLVEQNTAVMREWSLLDVWGISFDEARNELVLPETEVELLSLDRDADLLTKLTLATLDAAGIALEPRDETGTARVLRTVVDVVLREYALLPLLFVLLHERPVGTVVDAGTNETRLQGVALAEIYRVAVSRRRALAVLEWSNRIEARLMSTDRNEQLAAYDEYRAFASKPAEDAPFFMLVGAGRVPDAHAPPKQFLVLEPVVPTDLATLAAEQTGFYRPAVVTTLTAFNAQVTRGEAFVLGEQQHALPASLADALAPSLAPSPSPSLAPSPASPARAQTQVVVRQEVECGQDPYGSPSPRAMGTGGAIVLHGWSSTQLVHERRSQMPYTTVIEGPPGWTAEIISHLETHVVATLCTAPLAALSRPVRTPAASKTVLDQARVLFGNHIASAAAPDAGQSLVLVAATSTIVVRPVNVNGAVSPSQPRRLTEHVRTVQATMQGQERAQERLTGQPLRVVVDTAYDGALVGLTRSSYSPGAQTFRLDLVMEPTVRYVVRGGVLYYGACLGRYVVVDRAGAWQRVDGLSVGQMQRFGALLEQVGQRLEGVLLLRSAVRTVAVAQAAWILLSSTDAAERDQVPVSVESLLCPGQWAADLYQMYGVLVATGVLLDTLGPGPVPAYATPPLGLDADDSDSNSIRTSRPAINLRPSTQQRRIAIF